MGINKFLLFVLLLSPLYIQAAREVNSIKILESGHYTSISPDTEGYSKWCKLFKPTKEKLIDYFAKAKEAGFGTGWIHEYYSPCIASGTVTFKEGSYGVWGLHDSGLGSVYFKDKANSGRKSYFSI